MGDNIKSTNEVKAKLKELKKKNNHLLGTPEDKAKSWYFKIGNEWARHYTDEEMDDLANELIKWSYEDDALNLAGFCGRFNRTRDWLYDLEAKYPMVASALVIARNNLSNKYSVNSIKCNYYWAAVRAYGINYDKELKQSLKWLEAIKQDQGIKQENSTIIKEFNEFLEWKASKIRESQETKETNQTANAEDSNA
jgi:hypothetical protein